MSELNKINRPLARVIANVPPERVLTYERNGRLPKIGELGEFDQAFTSDSGVQMVSVYLLDSAGQELWAADMLLSEFVAVPRDKANPP
jgi:hypothetical protein